jgi:hypothetical protein
MPRVDLRPSAPQGFDLRLHCAIGRLDAAAVGLSLIEPKYKSTFNELVTLICI